MAISVFDLFSIGIGPSSSHTVGPMRAARMFAVRLKEDGALTRTATVHAELYGSLGATGHGHGTPKAVLLGLEGNEPHTVDINQAEHDVDHIRSTGTLRLLGVEIGDARAIAFDFDKDLVLHRRKTLPYHANGMTIRAYDAAGTELLSKTYYSVGGGFVVDEDAVGADRVKLDETVLKHPFHSGDDLLRLTHETGLSISGLMLENERAWRSEDEIRSGLLDIWRVMQACVSRGLTREGILPGGLKVRRRAALTARALRAAGDPATHAMEWATLYAMAVNEENAAGGRVVTAPTNGAAGIIPAVLHYYVNFVPGADEDGVVRFMLAAGAIGMLFKENASISGAEVGCQGEVGSACSMAAGALAEVLGGSPEQVENAAEIGMEHNLGLTCDPVGGLVQIPCIERNGMAAVKAVTAARMALRGDGRHHVSLDKVIKTMKDTGADMSVKYKETARGGLAVNIIEC
ncbi:L-serine ammonia-lyase [Streptomyces europaeiscabiei]|uniref:L-serine dehydratase n=8 Tax=Streptomyces europaeiscabiei TaxID=146819 RepID=A0ABU4NTD3_9ACTN|nr:L-serine ammonia-lyase [Streptomyces europaeiscabiei]MDX3549115.1 L-serine ammonia-lyase [Streptomyces europaeiscabiei]MDX3558333.1 L-serine ammonia-lyase [Streptomyces europaeiscabiei]MDX3667411.1 L-serine ammonia-lyase [Streptomyces europaeiscabiei]MDX3706186.1 L-serine ammonia-lyase [Streptomyces europaeiscabiei]MDX3778009.1 L-serine ammonia-lyase [Streptomyces europaeiscabiei]